MNMFYGRIHWHPSLSVTISNAIDKKQKYDPGNVAISHKIENQTGSQNITDMGHDHYKQQFDKMNDTDDKPCDLFYIR